MIRLEMVKSRFGQVSLLSVVALVFVVDAIILGTSLHTELKGASVTCVSLYLSVVLNQAEFDCDFQSGLHTANLSLQTRVGKLKKVGKLIRSHVKQQHTLVFCVLI